MADYPSVPIDANSAFTWDDNLWWESNPDGTVFSKAWFATTVVDAKVIHSYISASDRATLISFYNAHKQDPVVVNWQNDIYIMYFNARPVEQYMGSNLWNVSCEMRGHFSPASVVQTLAPLTQSASGSVYNSVRLGTASQTLAALTQSAAGAVVTPGAVSGSISQALAALTQSASGSIGGSAAFQVTNLLPSANNLTTSYFISSAIRTLYSGEGPNGLDRTLLEDDNGAGLEYLYSYILDVSPDTSTWTARFFLRKEGTGGAPYPDLGLIFHTASSFSASEGIRVRVDQNTGGYDIVVNSHSGTASVTSYDANWWEVKLDSSNGNSKSYVHVIIAPAGGSTRSSSTWDASDTGTCSIGTVELYKGKSKGDITGDPIKTTYYRIDGSDATASGTNWNSLPNCIDSSTSSYSYIFSPNENTLSAAGTNLVGVSGSIVGAFARIRLYNNTPSLSWNVNPKIYTDGKAETLVNYTLNGLTTVQWLPHLALTPPSAGWSVSAVQALEFEYLLTYVSGSGYTGVYICEIWVSEQ